jgi:hypothetical protein
VAVSPAVRRYYAERIFAQSGRDRAPPNFRPLEGTASGIASVEGCRGGGKNILEVFVLAEHRRVRDVRIACGLCNPAMYVGADCVAEWAKGRAFEEVLAVDPLRPAALDPLFERLGGPGRPDDAREKFQYALFALQNAVRAAEGRPPLPLPELVEPSDAEVGTADAEA